MLQGEGVSFNAKTSRKATAALIEDDSPAKHRVTGCSGAVWAELAQTLHPEHIPSSSSCSGTSTAFPATLPTALTAAEGMGSSDSQHSPSSPRGQQGEGRCTPHVPPGAAPSPDCEIQIPTRANPDLAGDAASSLPCQLPFPSLQAQRPVNSTTRALNPLKTQHSHHPVHQNRSLHVSPYSNGAGAV